MSIKYFTGILEMEQKYRGEYLFHPETGGLELYRCATNSLIQRNLLTIGKPEFVPKN